jgi:hypothetical protein
MKREAQSGREVEGKHRSKTKMVFAILIMMQIFSSVSSYLLRFFPIALSWPSRRGSHGGLATLVSRTETRQRDRLERPRPKMHSFLQPVHRKKYVDEKKPQALLLLQLLTCNIHKKCKYQIMQRKRFVAQTEKDKFRRLQFNRFQQISLDLNDDILILSIHESSEKTRSLP